MPDISSLSTTFSVRRLDETDIPWLYELCRGNPLFYRYHPPFVTVEDLKEDQQVLPPGKTKDDKHYIGFFSGGQPMAVMDLVLGYPQPDTAFIGFFMMEAKCQGKGIGSGIIGEVCTGLAQWGYRRVRLATDRENPQSNAFWQKNGFLFVEEKGSYFLRERNIS